MTESDSNISNYETALKIANARIKAGVKALVLLLMAQADV